MGLLEVLLPSACAGCGRYGPQFCNRCLAQLCPATRPQDRFLAPDPGVVIGEALDVALAAFAYEGVLRRALQRLKYGGAARIAAPLADSALPTLRQLVGLIGAAQLVPVPVHPERRRVRGYNQAALLTARFAGQSGLQTANLLRRSQATTMQHRLDRAARLRNLRCAFAPIPDARPPPAVILVDDILTTSATLESCASVLRGMGTERVAGIAIAREV